MKFLNWFGFLPCLLISCVVLSQTPATTFKGQLPNGLTYYLIHDPDIDQVNIELLLKAGYNNERPDQAQISHLLEHMGHEGSVHFPGDSMLKYTSSIGLRFGADVNAATSDWATRYYFNGISTGNMDAISNILLATSDILSGLTIDSGRLAVQRGVVQNEFSQRSSASMDRWGNLVDSLFQVKEAFKTSTVRQAWVRYLPTFDRAKAMEFYQQWYRPENAAIMVIGKFDVYQVEQMLKKHFSGIGSPKNRAGDLPKLLPSRRSDGASRTRVIYSLEDAGESNIYIIRPYVPDSTAYSIILNKMVGACIDVRLKKLLRGERAHFSALSARYTDDYTYFRPPANTLIIGFGFHEKYSARQSVEKLLEEIGAIASQGFTQEELQHAKRSLMGNFRTRFKRLNVSETYAEYFAAHFKGTEKHLQINDHVLEWEKTIASFSLQDMQKAASGWLAAPDNLTFVFPQHIDKNIGEFAKARMLEIMKELRDGKKFPSQIPNENTFHLAVSPKLPTDSQLSWLSRETCDQVPYWELPLSNGAKLITYADCARKTSSDGTITLLVNNPGGTSAFSGTDSLMVSCLPQLTDLLRLDEYDLNRIKAFANDREIKFSFFYYQTEQELRIEAPAEHMEDAFKILYLVLAKANINQPAFNEWRKVRLQELNNSLAGADAAKKESINAEISKWNLADHNNVTQVFKKVWRVDANTKFFAHGSPTDRYLEKMALLYLASIPGSVVQRFRAPAIPLPNIRQPDKISQGNREVDRISMAYQTPIARTIAPDKLTVAVLSAVIARRLHARLRQKEAGTYGVTFSTNLSEFGRDSMILLSYINFECMPGNRTLLIAAAREELSEQKMKEVTMQEINSAKEEVWSSLRERDRLEEASASSLKMEYECKTGGTLQQKKIRLDGIDVAAFIECYRLAITKAHLRTEIEAAGGH